MIKVNGVLCGQFHEEHFWRNIDIYKSFICFTAALRYTQEQVTKAASIVYRGRQPVVNPRLSTGCWKTSHCTAGEVSSSLSGT